MMTAGVMMTVETMETVAVTGVITVMKMMMYLILPLTLLSLMSPVTRLVVVLRGVALDQTETAGVMKSVSCAVTVVVTGATSVKLSLNQQQQQSPLQQQLSLPRIRRTPQPQLNLLTMIEKVKLRIMMRVQTIPHKTHQLSLHHQLWLHPHQ